MFFYPPFPPPPPLPHPGPSPPPLPLPLRHPLFSPLPPCAFARRGPKGTFLALPLLLQKRTHSHAAPPFFLRPLLSPCFLRLAKRKGPRKDGRRRRAFEAFPFSSLILSVRLHSSSSAPAIPLCSDPPLRPCQEKEAVTTFFLPRTSLQSNESVRAEEKRRRRSRGGG